MAKMYVANCTNQNQDFQYRILENPGVRKQEIAIGQQIQISGELTSKDIEYIVEQHARYGLVAVDEIDRTRDFIGLCYSVDKRIDVEKVRRAAVHNLDVLNERGRQQRKDAAVAVNNMIESESPNLKALELAVVEDERKDRETEVNETIRVDRAAGPDKIKTPVGSARGRKAN